LHNKSHPYILPLYYYIILLSLLSLNKMESTYVEGHSILG
jgi:hypothetical protein